MYKQNYVCKDAYNLDRAVNVKDVQEKWYMLGRRK